MAETTVTSGQVAKILTIFEEKGVTPERMTNVISSGLLAHILDKRANLHNDEIVDAALGLHQVLPEPIHFTVDYAIPLRKKAEELDLRPTDWKHVPLKELYEGFGEKRYRREFYGQVFRFREVYSYPLERISFLMRVADPRDPWEVAGIEHLLAAHSHLPAGDPIACYAAAGTTFERHGVQAIPIISICGKQKFGDRTCGMDYRKSRDNLWALNDLYLGVREVRGFEISPLP